MSCFSCDIIALILIILTFYFIKIHLFHLRSRKVKKLINYCNEKNQSPVNLETIKAVPKILKCLCWNTEFSQSLNAQTIHVNEETVRLEMKDTNVPILSGGPLNGKYRLVQTHFHWSAKDTEGSEHTLNSKQYPMEMHAVFLKGNLCVEEALEDADGVAVIGYLVELTKKSQKKSNSVRAFQVIANLLPKITPENRKVCTHSKLALNNLLQPFNFDYLTYRGSLTTPPCSIVVTWIIAPQVLQLTCNQLKTFRDLYKRNIIVRADNWRKIQPLEGRIIFRATSS